MIGLVLTESLPAWRIHFVPIEAKGLAQYQFLERLGFFGIDTETSRGGLTFLRKSTTILSQPESVLWITAQGEFVDPRERPISLKGGIGRLAHRLNGAYIVPLAIEYPFWNDRCPEALVRFGPAIPISSGQDHEPFEWLAIIEKALEKTMDALSDESRSRDPSAFDVLIDGTAGVGGVYDIWRRLRAIIGGSRFQSEHVAKPTARLSAQPGFDRGQTSNG